MKVDSTKEKYWNKIVRSIHPYVPGEQRKSDGLIKLNTNENPFPLPEAVQAKIKDIYKLPLNIYPQANHDTLRSEVARAWELSPEQIFAANGSDEALMLLFRAFLNPEDEVVIANPTYSLYPTLAAMVGAKIRKIESGEDFSIQIKDFIGPQKLTILANPNAPTGIALPLTSIRKLVSALQGILVVDEAYVDFGAESALPLIQEFDNLLVLRTMSKAYSLAGLRLGFALANQDLIEALYRIKDSYNLSAISQYIGIAAFQNLSAFKTNMDMVIWNREFLQEELAKRGFKCTNSKANFIFARHERLDSRELYNVLSNANILIRYFPAERTREWVRITIGTMQELKALLKVIDSLL